MTRHFGVNNFKVFKEHIELELRPLTIFTGTNSSGKSSYTQALRLFQNIKSNGDGMYNPYFEMDMDQELSLLGNFENILNNLEKPIELSTYVKWLDFDNKIQLKISFEKNTDEEVLKTDSKFTKLELVDLSDEEPITIFTLEDEGYYFVNELIDHESYKREKIPHRKSTSKLNVKYLFEKFVKLRKEIADFYISWRLLENTMVNLGYNKDELREMTRNEVRSFFYEMNDEKSRRAVDVWLNGTVDYTPYFLGENSGKWDLKSNLFKQNNKIKLEGIAKFNPSSTILDYTINGLPIEGELVSKIQTLELNNTFWLNLSFIPGVRNPNFSVLISEILSSDVINKFFPESKDRETWKDIVEKELNLENLVVNKGDNFNSFVETFIIDSLKSMFDDLFEFLDTKIDYVPSVRHIPSRFVTNRNLNTYMEQIINSISSKSNVDTKELNYWLKEFEIADELKIHNISEIGVSHLSLLKNGKHINIADVGYGVSQLLPILLRLCLYDKTPIIIEEPETNLHPALQSKLADFLISQMKKGRRIIIETHSEYLIRRLQYLVAKKQVNESSCVIYYFNSDSNVTEKEPKVKKIEITEDGNLTDSFGHGFFDEASRLQFELLKVNQTQFN